MLLHKRLLAAALVFMQRTIQWRHFFGKRCSLSNGL